MTKTSRYSDQSTYYDLLNSKDNIKNFNKL